MLCKVESTKGHETMERWVPTLSDVLLHMAFLTGFQST